MAVFVDQVWRKRIFPKHLLTMRCDCASCVLNSQEHTFLAILDVGGLGHVVYNRLVEIGVSLQRFDGASTEGVDTRYYVNARAHCDGHHYSPPYFNDTRRCRFEFKGDDIVHRFAPIFFCIASRPRAIPPRAAFAALHFGIGFVSFKTN